MRARDPADAANTTTADRKPVTAASEEAVVKRRAVGIPPRPPSEPLPGRRAAGSTVVEDTRHLARRPLDGVGVANMEVPFSLVIVVLASTQHDSQVAI